jgi:eukaryotic-like serine/threonine-protein kinase
LSAVERWSRIEQLFAEALDVPADCRQGHLEAACGGDAALRADVESLLKAHDAAGSFLMDPVRLPIPSQAPSDTAPPLLQPGARLGVFEITAPLGAGGMAAVYRARDTRLDRSVAIKVLAPRAELAAGGRDRFEREARAVSRLSHPHICALYDLGRATVSEGHGELEFLVMELVSGETLAERLARGRLPIDRAIEYAAEIADALACAHREGIVHRDLKPRNVMVTSMGTKLLDFGLAAFTTSELKKAPSAATRPGLMIGTVQYMAPEQIQGHEPDARADLFSLGLVIYEMLAGQRAFSRPSTLETLTAILHDEPPSLSDRVPAALRAVVAHCLEKAPDQRFQDAQDLAFALRSIAPSSPTASYEPMRSRRRRIRQALAAATLAVGAAVVARVTVPAEVDLGDYTAVPFAVEAAAETNPAWSPDGKSVAYVRTDGAGEPQIVVRSETSNVTTELTAGPSGAYQPFWSRDARRIFFGKNPIKSVSATGGEVRAEVPDATAADISPDGQTLAVWRSTDLDLGTVATLWTGAPWGKLSRYEPSPFALKVSAEPNVVRFSPNGRTILLWLTTGTRGLWLAPFPPRGRVPRRVFEDLRGEVAGADWMPDSRHIVLSQGGRLLLGDTRTGEMRRLLAGTAPAQWPVVAPAGDRLLFQEQRDSSAVVALSLAGGPPRVLVGTSQHAGSACWSPQGDRLAYVTDRRGTDEIWTRSQDESSDQPLVKPDDLPGPKPDRIFSVRFSPDGQWLSFATTASTDAGEFRSLLWIVPSRGGTPRPITGDSEGAIRASWSPDSRSLVARVLRDARWGLWEISLDSGRSYRAIPTPPDVHIWHAELSPTGEWIASVGRNRQGQVERTIIVSPNSGQVRVLPDLGSPALTWSRDGRTIYGVATVGGASHLRALDLTTGRVSNVADYGTLLSLGEPINDSLQFMLAPDGHSIVTTSTESRIDLWMLKNLNLPPPSWRSWPWPWNR